MHFVHNSQCVINIDNVIMKNFIIFIKYHLIHLQFETLQFECLKDTVNTTVKYKNSPQSCSLIFA